MERQRDQSETCKHHLSATVLGNGWAQLWGSLGAGGEGVGRPVRWGAEEEV